jgi:hypothetical protein
MKSVYNERYMNIKIASQLVVAFLILINNSLFATNCPLVKEYQFKYPNAQEVYLKNDVIISFFLSPDGTKYFAKAKHTIELLALKEGAPSLSFVQIPYSSFEKLNVIQGKYFLLDSANKRILKENVRVKYLDDKNVYLENIYYSDYRVKQFKPLQAIVPGIVLSYEYEYTIEDLKFLTSFYLQNANEYVASSSITITYPPQLSLHVYPFNLTNVSKKEEKEGVLTRVTYLGKNLEPLLRHELSPAYGFY